MTRWLASDALPGRVHPDPTEAAAGRVEGGAAVEELDRVGEWVRVRDPGGNVWWVDGRRLEPLEGSADHRTGLPWPLVAIAALGVGLLFTGVTALVVAGSDDNTTTTAERSTTVLVPTTAAPLSTVATAQPATEPPTTTTPVTTATIPQVAEAQIQLGDTFEPTRGIPPPRVAGLAVGPTGIWAMRPETGVLYRVDPATNEISLSVPVADRGTARTKPALAAGHGSVWVAARAMDQVIRVAEDSGEITGRIAVGEGASDVQVTSDAVWVAIEGFTGVEIVRIDPATDEVTARHRLTDEAAFEAEIVAAHGVLWVGYAWSFDGWIARVEPSTGEVTATAELTCLSGLAAHRDEILAVDSCPGDGGKHLVSIDPESGSISEEHRLRSVGPISSDGERLAMQTTVEETAVVAWWPGPANDMPGPYPLAAPVESIVDLVVDDGTVWVATFGSPLLVRIDGLWGTS